MNEVIGYGFWQSEVTRVDIAPFTKIIKASSITKPRKSSRRSRRSVPTRWCDRPGRHLDGPLLGWVWQDSKRRQGHSGRELDHLGRSAGLQARHVQVGSWDLLLLLREAELSYDPKTGQWKQQPQIPEWAYPINYCNDCGEQIVTIQYTDKDNITQSMHAWDIYLRGMAQYGVGCLSEMLQGAT